MSNLPPSGPPQPPLGPPPGQPPYGAGQPEILDPSDGTSIASPGRGRGGRRKALLVGGGVVGLALVGGGAWAAMSFMSTGSQPAEVLPATALGYVSIDLDPSGSQKIEAVRTLNKFPAFADSVGVSPEGDLRKTVFEKALAGEECSVSYDDDIKPWLGDRAALAAVPGGDTPQPVFVLQVTDEAAAEAGLTALRGCGGGADEKTGWVIDGGWAVVAPTEELARATTEAAAEATLADDEDFQRWTGETGDTGIVTMYAAPGAGAAILQGLGDGAPAGASAQLENFQGLAATIRFADGALELEGAGQVPENAAKIIGAADVAGSVASLPDDTAAVLGLSLGKGWFDKALSGFTEGMGGDAEGLISQFEAQSGLQIPEDIEALTSGGVVLAVGAGLDPEAIANATDPSAIPVGLKLSGDAGEIESVIAKITAAIPGGAEIIGSSTSGDTVVVGPDPDFREQLAADGGLGDSETFTSVVAGGDSPSVLFVDVNAFDAAISSLAGGDQQVLDNVAPLRAIGASSSLDGDTTRFTLRISTDD